MNKGTFRILTHGGKAHLDEMVASALLSLALDRQPDEILRLENREIEELVSQGTLEAGDWVLDCGLQLDPGRQLFDHHQDGNLDSTALLIFDEYFPELHESRLHDSIRLLSRVDTQGFQSLNDYQDLDESAKYSGFTQKLLLKGFELDPLDAVRMLSAALQDNIEFERLRNKALEWLKNPEHTEILELDGFKVLNYLHVPPEELTSPMRSADKEMVDEFGIVGICSFDEKKESGHALFRTIHGQDILDFTQCHPSQTEFCHPGGFLLKFVAESDEEWKRLFRESILKPE